MTKRFEFVSPREFQRLTTLKKTRYLAELQTHLKALRQATRAPAAGVNSIDQPAAASAPVKPALPTSLHR